MSPLVPIPYRKRRVHTELEVKRVWRIAWSMHDPSTMRKRPHTEIAAEFTRQTGLAITRKKVAAILDGRDPNDYHTETDGLKTAEEIEASLAEFWRKRWAQIEAAQQKRQRRRDMPLVKQLLKEYRSYQHRWNRQEVTEPCSV